MFECIDRDEKDVYFSGKTGYINRQKNEALHRDTGL
jgi:hypothetical protein